MKLKLVSRLLMETVCASQSKERVFRLEPLVCRPVRKQSKEGAYEVYRLDMKEKKKKSI